MNTKGIYIKLLAAGAVILAGTIATPEMSAGGFMLYEGEIPTADSQKCEYLAYVDGELVVKVDEAKLNTQKAIEYQAFLDDTNEKMTLDYEPEDGEDMAALKAARKEAKAFLKAYRAA